MNQKYAEAYVEVLDILNHMSPADIAKVSKKFISFLEKNASKEYIANLDYSKKLKDMDLKDETKGLLAIMYKSYWCTEKEKEILQQKFYENEKIYQKELYKKYNPDSIFVQKQENNSRIIDNNPSTEYHIVKYETSLFRRIMNKIRSFFRKDTN